MRDALALVWRRIVRDAEQVLDARRAEGASEDVRATAFDGERTTPLSVTWPSLTSTLITVRVFPEPVQNEGSSSICSVITS